MTLNHQSNILACLAAIAVAAVLVITLDSAIEVRRQTEQIAMAERTAKGVTHFRYLIMETALYHERRSMEQWRERIASFRDTLMQNSYSEPGENTLLAREKANLEVIARLYERLANSDSVAIAAPHTDSVALESTANMVSALFLTTQDMVDDAFELVRLNRLDLEAAQSRAERLMLLNILILAALIAAGCVIIKRRVLLPIAALQKGMERVTKGDLAFRLNLGIDNEIGFLAGTFDNMTHQLARSHDAMAAENAERQLAQTALQETNRQLADKGLELTRAQEQLQIIIDHIPALVVYWDCQLLNRFANKAYLEWFGVTPQQMHGNHISDLVGEDRFQEIRPYLMSALEGKPEIFERVIHYPSGQQRHALFSYIPDMEDGKVKGLYGFVSDITPLRQAQAAQVEALAQLQSTVDAASEFSIITTDLDGVIRMFSVGAEKMLGYLAEETVGKATLPIVHMPDEVRRRGAELATEFGRPVEGFDVLVERVRQGGAETREWTYVRKDGSRLPVQLTVTPVFSQNGKITGFLGIAKDITQDRKTTEELRAATAKAESANRAKSEFVANMSHELRTPMNAVLGMAHLLSNTDLSIDQKKYLDMILASGRSLLGILNDILDFSKIEAGRMRLSPAQFSLGDLLNTLAATMSVSAGDKDLELAIAVEAGVPQQLIGDAMRLEQVLINLVGNAIKFTEQGEVSLTVASLTPQDGSPVDSVGLRFSVRDTGIGMNAEQQSCLFTAFMQADSSMTRRFGGTGLGLAISKRLVDLLNGTIEARSELGKGSEFCINVPFQIAGIPQDVKPVGNLLSDLRFLVVDDNRTSRDCLSKTLHAWNCQVDCAESGARAIELFKAAQAKNAGYNVLLADWQMPGMDGLSTIDAIRKLNPASAMPIILMANAFGRSKLMELEASAPVDAILIKPVTCPGLFHTVREILETRSDRMHDIPPEADGDSVPPNLSGARILLVEDNPANQAVAQAMLEYSGAAIDIAENGRIAVDLLRREPQRFDIVLMDVQMPVMDGFAAARLIRSDLGLTLPILAMTAGVTESERLQCIDAGMDDFISKPIEIGQMFMTIGKHLPASGGCAPISAEPEPLSDEDKAVLDPDHLLACANGNQVYRNTITGVLKNIVEGGTGPVAEARLAWTEGRSKEAAQALHALRGVIGTLGAKRFSDTALELETALLDTETAKEPARIEALFLSVERELTETISRARAWLEKQRPSYHAADEVSAPDMAQLRQLRLLLAEKNLAACDLYAKLRQALPFHEKRLDIESLDQAMDALDFEKAIRCLRLIENQAG